MISPVSSLSNVYPPSAAQTTQAKPPAPPKPTPQDSVQLSPAAKAAVGDVDHDGDSH